MLLPAFHLTLDSESVGFWFFCQITKSSSVSSSVIPLLRESIGILMQRTPPSLDHALPDCYQRVSTLHITGQDHQETPETQIWYLHQPPC